MVALLWPSRVSGILDGPPLDTPFEALTLGLLVPVLVCVDPSFLYTVFARGLVVAIIALKLGAALTLRRLGYVRGWPHPCREETLGKRLLSGINSRREMIAVGIATSNISRQGSFPDENRFPSSVISGC